MIKPVPTKHTGDVETPLTRSIDHRLAPIVAMLPHTVLTMTWTARRAGAFGIVIFLAAGAIGGRAIGQTQPPRPVFTETACDGLPDIVPELRPRLRCGTVGVPRDYHDSSTGQFKLAVVVVKSVQQPVSPEPVVYISGGPGSPLTIHTDYQASHPYAPGRDLILVDQRGVGRSEPDLCPALNGRLLDAAVALATETTEAAQASRRTVYAACREQATAHGLDLRNFGTTVTVEDFESVRQALGIARWNVYGESYGTTVAMTLVAQHPGTVRSVVLDSVYPPDPVIPSRSIKVTEARDAFFASCDRDEACAAVFPDIAGLYRETLQQLGRTPLSVPTPPQLHRPGDRQSLTASLFEVIVGRLIYYPTAYPGLPRLIAAVHDGDTGDFAAAFASEVAAAGQLNMGAHTAVECRDRPLYRNPLAEGADTLDRMGLHGICKRWSELGPSPVIPIGADVPILVLAGQFDPVAGLSSSRQVATLIGPRARWVGFPRIGHNVRHFSPCATTIVADFIGNPTQPPDTSCADRQAPIRFLPSHRPP